MLAGAYSIARLFLVVSAVSALAAAIAVGATSTSCDTQTNKATKVTVLGLPTNEFSAQGAEPEQRAFTREQDWVEFWKAHSQAPALMVDFSQYQIAAVLAGAKPNPGYGVRIEKASDDGKQITLEYTQLTPAVGVMYITVITYPFDAVAVPAGKPVRFVERTRRQEGPGRRAESLAPRAIDVTSLRPPTRTEYVLFEDERLWTEFWKSRSAAAVPEVNFAQTVVAGILQPDSALASELTAVEKVGGEVRVKLSRSGTAPGRKSVLAVVPRADRIDVGWLQSEL